MEYLDNVCNVAAIEVSFCHSNCENIDVGEFDSLHRYHKTFCCSVNLFLYTRAFILREGSTYLNDLLGFSK